MRGKWKDIVGYEGIYLISNIGNVRRIGKRNNKNKFPGCGNKRYWAVGLNKNGKKTTYAIHSLVAAAFIGKRPKNYQVNHKDGNPKNNNVENLEYTTPYENREHAKKLQLYSFGENHHNAKLSYEKALAIRELYKRGYGYKQLGRIFSINEQTAYYVVKNKTWREPRRSR